MGVLKFGMKSGQEMTHNMAYAFHTATFARYHVCFQTSPLDMLLLPL